MTEQDMQFAAFLLRLTRAIPITRVQCWLAEDGMLMICCQSARDADAALEVSESIDLDHLPGQRGIKILDGQREYYSAVVGDRRIDANFWDGPPLG